LRHGSTDSAQRPEWWANDVTIAVLAVGERAAWKPIEAIDAIVLRA
jgi:hypothetical protein